MSSHRPADEQALHDYTDSLRRWLGSTGERALAAGATEEELWQHVQSAVEELSVSEEELRVTNDELRDTRFQLEQERARYVDLFESAPDGYVVTDRAGVIRQTNRSAGELLGVQPHYLAGKPLLLYVGSADRTRLWTELEPLMRGRQETTAPLRWQAQLEPRGGGRRMVELSVAAAGSELRWMVRDISERINAELAKQQLRNEAARRQALEVAEQDARFLAQAGESLSGADTQTLQQRVVDVTASMLTDFAILLQDENGVAVCTARAGIAEPLPRVIGAWSEHDAVGRVFKQQTADVIVDPALIASELPAAFASWARTRQINSVLLLPLLAGGRSYGVLLAGNVGARPSCGSKLLIARTFADRAAAAFQTAQLLREAQQANEAKSAFLAIVSHELRTPLTSVIGYAELLAMETAGALNDQQRKFLTSLESSARHLVKLVDQVLLYARTEPQSEQPQRQVIEVSAFVREVVALFEPAALARSLELQLGDMSAINIETSPDKLRQVLINLLANAVKFTDNGFVRVRIADAGDDVLIEVADSGIGFEQADAARIFEPFQQIEKADTRKSGGVGLGLAVCQRLVQELEGTITASSEPGHGSSFTVRLPKRFRDTVARDSKSLFW